MEQLLTTFVYSIPVVLVAWFVIVRIGSAYARITSIIEAVKLDIDELGAHVASVHKRVMPFAAPLTVAHATQTAFDALQDKVAAIRADVDTLRARADEMDDAVDADSVRSLTVGADIRTLERQLNELGSSVAIISKIIAAKQATPD